MSPRINEFCPLVTLAHVSEDSKPNYCPFDLCLLMRERGFITMLPKLEEVTPCLSLLNSFYYTNLIGKFSI